jgi:hypothetical protein
MAGRKKPPRVGRSDACDCAMRRTHREVRYWTHGAGVAYDCRTVGDELFCLCRVCGTRWRVTELHEYDGGFADTSYVWEESAWTEEFVAAKQFEALYEAKQEREREERADYSRQRDPDAGRGSQAPSASEQRATPHQIDQTTEQTGSQEWRWVDGRGVACGCRIEGSRLAVWTENPFGGSGTNYSVSEFLDGRHAKVLPPAVASQVRHALTAQRKE